MSGGRFDWLAELGGAGALATAGAYAAFKIAPSLALPPASAMLAGGAGFLGAGLLVMKAVGSGSRVHSLPALAIAPIEAALDDERIFDAPDEEPLLLEDIIDDAALLLEDALPATNDDSRVVQLFAHPAMPTPGQLKDRIDRHLAGTPMADLQMSRAAAPDATEALYAALDELKRSLR